MNDKEYNFDEMYEGASSILNVDKDLQIPSEKKEYQNPYKLDEGLMKLGYEYDSNGIYIHFNPTYQAIGVENDDKFTTQDNIYLMISRDFDTKKKILLKFRWAKKTSDGYSLSRGFEFNNSLDIGDEKILKDLNKKVSFSGGKHDNPSSEGSYVKFVDDFTSQIIESNCLSILKEVNYDTPEEIDDESSENTNNDIQSFEDYPEDIQNEAMKLINEGRLFNETQKSVSLTHKGHHTTRDALILCESSIFVGDGIHTWIGGDSGEGKSDLAFAIGKIFPNHYVKILRNISPKHIYYDCENYNDDYNILIFDDLPLNEDMINILKELSDNAKKVKELKTVINGKSETFTLQGKFIVVLTYAKEIDDEELKNRLFNIGVTIIDKSDGNINIKSKIRDNNVIGGNDNPIIERNRLIIQASIHYLIEQDMNIFNPFLSIFNPEDYNNRDVNHLINMVKAKTFFEYSQRRQIQINEDLAITIGSYDDFNYANNIWAKDVEGIKYKLSDKQKLVLKVMEDNGYIMTDDKALTHVEKLSEKYYNTQSRKARDKLLEDECTKKKLSDLTGIKENTLTNVLDRIEGTSKSLVEHKLIGRYKLNEDDKFSKVIYYKRVIDGESLKSENDSMLTLYFQNTKEKNPSFVLKKILIDLLYYVKILINERGYIYLKNYCDNHHGDIDVDSYDSIVDFMEGFFNGLDYDECTINIEDSSFYDIEQMSNFKGEIDNEFDEKIEIYMSSSDEEFLTKEGKMKENAPINDCGKNSLCISEIQSEHKNDLTIKGILEGIKIDFSIASQIIECLIDDDLTKFEIQRKLYPCPNPEDIDEKLLIGIEMTLKRLVDNSIISIKTSYGQMYHLEDETRKLLEGDDD